MTFVFERFGYNIFLLPWIMPFMIIWFGIWYVMRLSLTLTIGIMLLIYNIWLYLIAVSIWIFQAILIFIPWTDDVNWLFFDNFYSGLQTMATDYENFVKVYPGWYLIWLLFWPYIFLAQYFYYFFTWINSETDFKLNYSEIEKILLKQIIIGCRLGLKMPKLRWINLGM